MKKKSIFLSVSIALMSLALTGCPERKKIADINANPSRYMNKQVTVVGRVTRSYGAAGFGVFEVDDGTGRMWILSEGHGVPTKDTYVGVQGTITPGVTYSGRNYGTGMRTDKDVKYRSR